MDINYLIFETSELSKVDFTQILTDTLVYSVDGSKTFIKWIGDEPSFISDLNSKSVIYNNEEIIEILKETEWLPLPIVSGTTEN